MMNGVSSLRFGRYAGVRVSTSQKNGELQRMSNLIREEVRREYQHESGFEMDDQLDTLEGGQALMLPSGRRLINALNTVKNMLTDGHVDGLGDFQNFSGPARKLGVQALQRAINKLKGATLNIELLEPTES